MTATLHSVTPEPEHGSWDDILVATIRPEFAVAVYVADSDDSILGRPLCTVPGCEVIQRASASLCRLHNRRWHDDGEPPMDEFRASQGARSRPGQIGKCLVPSCRRSRVAHDLCIAHLGRWRANGLPNPIDWALTQQAARVRPGACRIDDCHFPLGGGPSGFCDYHSKRFGESGDGDPEEFARLNPQRAQPRLRWDMTLLSGTGRLEAQFILQQRFDERGARLEPHHFRELVDAMGAGGSLFDRSEAEWIELIGIHRDAALLRYAQDRLHLLRAGGAMDWDDDVWDMRRAAGTAWDVRAGRRLQFDRIPQPWLRQLAKRWSRVRLASRSPLVIRSNLADVTRFAVFLHDHNYAPTHTALRRAHIEAFLGWLPSSGLASNTRAGLVSAVRTFLDDCAANGWAEGVPANARLFPGDGPRFHTGLPRFISEDVMCQLEDPTNVARWANPNTRNLFIMMRETGKRIGEAVTLPRDPIVLDSVRAPCLLYRDHKGNRDAIVPISTIAANAIRDQQRIVNEEWPTSPWLFPRQQANADGSRHVSAVTFGAKVNDWLRLCEIHDANGNPVTVSSHQFRHTLATRMLNLGVPQHIVQRMLGHVGVDTVATYARLHDTTMRREFEQYQQRRVDVHGEIVTYADTAPTAEAEWLKHRLSKALQTLPNGECGRPIQQTCPHPNACLTCDDFLTDAKHLPAHRDQLERTRRLIAVADADGNFRMAEMNRRVETNLANIVETLQRLDRIEDTDEQG